MSCDCERLAEAIYREIERSFLYATAMSPQTI